MAKKQKQEYEIDWSIPFIVLLVIIGIFLYAIENFFLFVIYFIVLIILLSIKPKKKK